MILPGRAMWLHSPYWQKGYTITHAQLNSVRIFKLIMATAEAMISSENRTTISKTTLLYKSILDSSSKHGTVLSKSLFQLSFIAAIGSSKLTWQIKIWESQRQPWRATFKFDEGSSNPCGNIKLWTRIMIFSSSRSSLCTGCFPQAQSKSPRRACRISRQARTN